MHRSLRDRNPSWDLESPATGYRRLKRIVLSVLTRENSKSRCRRRCEEWAERWCAAASKGGESKTDPVYSPIASSSLFPILSCLLEPSSNSLLYHSNHHQRTLSKHHLKQTESQSHQLTSHESFSDVASRYNSSKTSPHISYAYTASPLYGSFQMFHSFEQLATRKYWTNVSFNFAVRS